MLRLIHSKYFSLLYITALIFVGSISVIFYLFINDKIKTSKEYAHIINIAGLQRMLTYKTTLLKFNQIEYPSVEGGKELSEFLKKLREDHQYLGCERLEEFECDIGLDKEITILLSHHLNVLQYSNKEELNQYIEKELPSFFKKLDARVKFFEIASINKSDEHIEAEKNMLFIIILTLFFEALFIFRPILKILMRSVNTLTDKERALKNSLRDMSHLLDDLNHELKTPLNELYHRITGIKDHELMEKINEPYVKIEQAISSLIAIHKKDAINYKEYYYMSSIAESLPVEIKSKIHIKDNSYVYLILYKNFLGIFQKPYEFSNDENLEFEVFIDGHIEIQIKGEERVLEKFALKVLDRESTVDIEKKLLISWMEDYELSSNLKPETLEIVLKPKMMTSTKTTEIKEVLIVDDNKINLKILESALNKFNVKVTMCSDGNEAIYACSQNSFDLIFMDLRMPKMNGEEAIKEILKIPNYNPHICVVTANTFNKDRINSLKAGAHSFVEKPISKIKIEEELNYAKNFYCRKKILFTD